MSYQYGTPLTEFKADSLGGFEGYGAVFGNVDQGGDVIIPGAFRESIKVREPAMLWSHNPSEVIGKYDVVEEDSRGLFVAGRFADTQSGQEKRKLVQMGAATGLSIGYAVKEKTYRKDGVRELHKLIAGEVSVVAMPMNNEARIGLVKSFVGGTEREIEHVLRDAGLSRTFAKSVVSELCQRDVEPEDDDAWLAAFKSETDQLRLENLCNAIRGI